MFFGRSDHCHQWFYDGFLMLLPSLSMVFDGSGPLVKRCDGSDGSLWSNAVHAHSKLHKRSQCVLTIADTFTPPISNLHACKTAEKACPLLLHLYASWLCENVVLDDWQLEGLRVCLGCIQNVPCPQDEKVCAQAVSKMYPIPKVKK